VLVVFILTYLVAPLTLRLIDGRKAPLLKFRFTDTIREKLFSGRKEIALTLLLIAGVSLFFIPGIKFRTNLETYIPRHTAAYENTLLMQEAFHSLAEIDILVEPGRDVIADSSGNLSGLLIPAIAEFSEVISFYPGVASVQSVRDQIEFEQSRTIFGIPAVRFPRQGNPYVSGDREKYRINVKLKGQEDIGVVTERISDDFKKYEPELTYSIYSEFLMFDYISTSVTRSLLRSLLFSAILIFLTFFTITTNIRAVLASILANLVPLGFLVLIFVVFRVDMNITTSITLVICLGLIVDDTIQILYRRVRLDEPMEELGFGVLTTTLIMAGGFLSFLISQSRPIQIFGLLCAIVFLIAAVSDMTIISWLLENRNKGISRKTSG
jgi:predicted RND superfamily exporter protein